MRSKISMQFHALTSIPESQAGLAEGALVLAAESRDDLNMDLALATLDALVEGARPLVKATNTLSSGIAALNHFLFELEGFSGNREHYEDPRNSDLSEVLIRRRGLPITLSILYVEIARRLGIEAYGVGFPGHFLSKVVDTSRSPHEETFIDPFFGRVLRREECLERIQTTTGASNSIDTQEKWLRPATALEIYTRMLNNLKILYLKNGDDLSALGCFDRILILSPNTALEYRDRGFLLERLECTRAAIADYEQFLELAPNSQGATAIRLRRTALSDHKPVLN